MRRWGVAVASLVGAWSVSALAFAQSPRVTRTPRVAHFVAAEYPAGEPVRDTAVSVLLIVTVSETGAVTEATVSQSAGAAFDEAARRAVLQFTFTPGEIDGRPSSLRIQYRYRFTPPAPVVAPTPAPVTAPPSSATPTVPTTPASPTTPRTATLPPPDPDAVSGEVRIRATVQRRSVVSTEVNADTARRLPGTQGDVLRVVENLPGVARAAVGSGQLVVWGAAPDDTRVVIDGVPLPRLYHNGGLRSVVSSEFVQSVELAPGAYGAAYGRGIGGLVGVTTRNLDERGVHGALSADLYDLGGALRVNLGRGVRVAIAGRRSHLGALLGAVSDQDLGPLLPVPQYSDLQARVSYTVSERESLDVTALLSNDAIDRAVVRADPAATTRERRTISFSRYYLRWQRVLADGASVNVTPWIGVDHRSLENTVGQLRSSLESDAVVGGLRASWRRRVRPWVTVDLGLDAEVTRADLARDGSTASPAREGDARVFGQPPPEQIASDRWATTTLGLAPWAELDFSLAGGRLHINPGLRVDPYARSVSRRTPVEGETPALGLFAQDFSIEPRLSVRYALRPGLTVKVAGGVFRQQPSPDDLSAAFGNPTLGLARAYHALVGVAVTPVRGVSVEAAAFYAPSQDLAVRSAATAPLLAQALEPIGRGLAYGAQLIARFEPSRRLVGWVSYSLLRSERTDAPGAAARLSDYDQTHVLTAVASWQPGRGWEVGLRFRLATGYPRTPVTGAWLDARSDRYQPLLGARNTERLPTFVQLDARVSKRFSLGRTNLEVYLDVQNVTDQSNAEEYVYAQDYSRRGVIPGIPFLPVLGARWVF